MTFVFVFVKITFKEETMSDDDPKRVPPITRRGLHHGSGGKGKKAFTHEEVWEIRQEYLDGATQESLARKHDVSRPTIIDVIRGQNAYRNM